VGYCRGKRRQEGDVRDWGSNGDERMDEGVCSGVL